MYNASHHSLEWITTPVVMKFIENFSQAKATTGLLQGYDVNWLFNNTSLYIVPMVNPDGVDLVLDQIPHTSFYYISAENINDTGRPLGQVWNANIRGTDLNLNYPAGWERAREIRFAQGYTKPSVRYYVGPTPLSEPESLAMAIFTINVDPVLTISLHAQGGEIYWDYLNLATERDLEIARRFSVLSGYTVAQVPPESSFAGYKDWFIQYWRKPGFTIEVGHGVNPLPIWQAPIIYRALEAVFLEGMFL